MSITMGRCIGALVVLYTVAACDSSGAHPANPGITDPEITGTGGTDPQGQGGTNPQGQGGTDPQGQGGTDPQGQGGTDLQGQGGTDPQGQGGTDPQGQGGVAGEAGSAGAAGEGGAAGASACTNEHGYECPSCDEDYVHVECGGPHCVCEREDGLMKTEYEALLACDLDEPCPLSTQDSDVTLNTWENGECLLEALRDRTPGRYRLSTSGGDQGYVYDEITIILDGSDEVILFDMQTSGLLAGNLTRQYIPASCTLKSYEELDACVTAGTDVSGVVDDGICTHPTDWTENCEILQNPECPGE